MVSWWDLVYRMHLHSLFWSTDKPPGELVELVEGKRLKPCRALDVGCGTGSYVIYLASMGFEAVGIDVSSAAIKKARAKIAERNVDCRFHRVNFLDVEALSSVIKEPFDIVMDYGCLHSLSNRDRKRYPHSLKHVTHLGSLYLLWAFHSGSWVLNRHQSVDPKEVRELFSNDFEIIEERIATRQKMLHILERK